ncbi:hypothetical protein HCN44_011059 [Aphidius gifuensis]|uniref:Uncharacterized protein n=1 Tax=Aphidius gifuensis TaxID=684658 RepID=A0A835CW94_APHGI|nr:hypothetical protein HCN44_011059 [Aphidius gifuensis]
MALDSKKKQTGSAGGTPDKKWVHEDRMKFLSDIDTNEETDSNIAEQDINVKNKYKKRKNHQEQKVEALQHTLEQLISKCAPPPPPPPPPPPQISQQQHLQQPELKNPHVLGFLHFMGTIIDDLPPDLLQEAMLKIHVLLDEYRRKAVDQL